MVIMMMLMVVVMMITMMSMLVTSILGATVSPKSQTPLRFKAFGLSIMPYRNALKLKLACQASTTVCSVGATDNTLRSVFKHIGSLSKSRKPPNSNANYKTSFRIYKVWV